MITASGKYDTSRSSTQATSRLISPGWWKPQRKAWFSDVARLRGPDAYGGSDLGYDQNTLSMLPGGARDLSAGAAEGAVQDIQDAYAAPGGAGVGSYAQNAELAGAAESRASDIARAGREATLSDAGLRREDLQRRLSTGLDIGNLASAMSGRRNNTRQYNTSWGLQAGYSK